jgi:hypothetical protein
MTASARIILVLASAWLAASCAPADPAADPYPLEPGLRTTIKAFGNHYESEAVDVQNGYSSWKVRWGDHVVATYKIYKGIFPIFSRERGSEDFYHYEADMAAIDSLFPLAVGNEATLEGTYQDNMNEGAGKLWSHILVRKESEIMVKDHRLPVFLIDITIEKDIGGSSVRESRTLWYSPELGFSLKTEYRWGEKTYSVRVLSVELPEGGGAERPQRNLGTVMI